MFPFKFESKTYSTCTNRLKNKTNHLPWCSTKVDKKGRHISSRGNWGNCDETCPIDCLAVGGPGDGLPCVFPFKFHGKTYSSCTNKVKHLTNNLPWCSTKVDKRGKHISGKGHWGNCDETCRLPPDEKNKSDEKETNPGLLINMF